MREGIFYTGLIILSIASLSLLCFGFYQHDIMLMAVGLLLVAVVLILFSERKKIAF